MGRWPISDLCPRRGSRRLGFRRQQSRVQSLSNKKRRVASVRGWCLWRHCSVVVQCAIHEATSDPKRTLTVSAFTRAAFLPPLSSGKHVLVRIGSQLPPASKPVWAHGYRQIPASAASLPELGRHSMPIRQTYEDGLRRCVAKLAALLPDADSQSADSRATAIFVLMVGTFSCRA